MHRNTRFLIHILRFTDNENCTRGILYINDSFQCFTLEDPYRESKISGITRIPNGIYELGIKESSPMSDKYAKRFPEKHKGMIWIKGIPNFKNVYFHIGNTPNDTQGCVLVGETFSLDGYLASSTNGYLNFYDKVINSITKSKQYVAIGEINNGLSVNYV